MELPDFDVNFADNSPEAIMISINGDFTLGERIELQTHIQQELDLDFSEQGIKRRK